MSREDIAVGERYILAGKVTVIRVLEELPGGGWTVFNEATKRTMRVGSEKRIKRVAFNLKVA